MGLTGSAEGTLSLQSKTISFTAFGRGALTQKQLTTLAEKTSHPDLIGAFAADQGAVIFKHPVSQIENLHFPWYSFDAGMNLTLAGEKYRFSLVRPQNLSTSFYGLEGVANIPDARKVGKTWKKLLTP